MITLARFFSTITSVFSAYVLKFYTNRFPNNNPFPNRQIIFHTSFFADLELTVNAVKKTLTNLQRVIFPYKENCIIECIPTNLDYVWQKWQTYVNEAWVDLVGINPLALQVKDNLIFRAVLVLKTIATEFKTNVDCDLNVVIGDVKTLIDKDTILSEDIHTKYELTASNINVLKEFEKFESSIDNGATWQELSVINPYVGEFSSDMQVRCVLKVI